MAEHHLKVEKTARYYTLGELGTGTKNIWIVCHGYAQLAGDFIKDFEGLADAENYFVAPEGLSRFYTKGFFGGVGATWMTKEDRLQEIQDYVNYLQKLYEQLKSETGEDVTFQLLGFSQGVATISRWVTLKQPDFQTLWLCSGEIPLDLDWQRFSEISQKHQVKIVYGTNDPFIPNGMMKKIKQKLEQQQIEFELLPFEGGHEINTELLQVSL